MKRVIKMPKKAIITALILCGLIVSIPLSVKAYNNHNYNSYLKKGQECFINESYEEAVYNFDNALKHDRREENEINKLIDRAIMLNQSMHSFEDGVKHLYDKKYEEAIYAFEKVNKEDSLRYDVAQEKIKESKKSLAAENIEAAKNEAKSLNYGQAIAYLNIILKVEPKNQEALLLKHEYTDKLVTLAAAK